MLGDDPPVNGDSPTISRSLGGSNSLNLSLRAIERFHSTFKSGDSSNTIPVEIIVEVVDEITSQEIVFPSV